MINWENADTARLPEQPLVPDDPLEVNELDELFTFVESKNTTSTLPRK